MPSLPLEGPIPSPMNVETPTLAAQFRKRVPQYAGGALCLGVFQFAMNRIDWLSKSAVDAIFGPHPGDASEPARWMLGLAVVAFSARLASRGFIFNAGRDAEYDLRKLLLERLHRLGMAFYRTMSAGEIMSRATNDILQVRLLLGFGVLNVINVVFAFASAFQIMVGISPKLTLAALVNFPIVIFFSRGLSRALYTRNKANQETLGRMSEVLQGNLAGVRVVRSLALDDVERRRFDEANRAYLEASLALARLRGSMSPIMAAASAVSVVVFFGYGGSLLLKGPEAGGLSKGEFFAFWLALGRVTWPMLALGLAIAILQRGRAGFARLLEILDAKPEVVDGSRGPLREVQGALQVRDLSFSYETKKDDGGKGKEPRYVLQGVSFEVPPGKSLAIMGRTGAGKSTLAMLLTRLLPTPPTSVFIDGIDVCELPLSSVRGVIGYAQQDAFLFSTTVTRNIAFAMGTAADASGDAALREAAKEAQVLDEVLSLPDKFDTVVGERGVQLSGGQKQRIALARALAWGPRILMLDDPLSAVDAKTEAAILEALDRQAAQRTVVLITHRVAAASRCDQILVLDEGRIVEQGNHSSLMALGGIYTEFAAEQQRARELETLAAEEAPPFDASAASVPALSPGVPS